jgi:hypothetical protein
LGVQTLRFGNWICYRPQVKGEKTPKDENRSSFRNVVFLLSRTPDDGKSPKTQ